MADLSLRIQLTSNDTREINEVGQKVTIVKEVDGTNGSRTVWLAFSPFEGNDVEWQTEYGVYASNTQVLPGATISMLSSVNPAQKELSYPFENGTFGNPTNELPDMSYGVRNNSPDLLTFGLAQAVSANGSRFDSNPLNAVPIRNSQNGIFRPVERVQVFLSANFDNGVVITNVIGDALTVDLTNEPNQTIHFNGSNFVPGPLP